MSSRHSSSNGHATHAQIHSLQGLCVQNGRSEPCLRQSLCRSASFCPRPQLSLIPVRPDGCRKAAANSLSSLQTPPSARGFLTAAWRFDDNGEFGPISPASAPGTRHLRVLLSSGTMEIRWIPVGISVGAPIDLMVARKQKPRSTEILRGFAANNWRRRRERDVRGKPLLGLTPNFAVGDHPYTPTSLANNFPTI
ncbi:hypothetical protein LMG9964_02383 [Paraburkholderia phenoliruptrix]|uniref:Uncharacterized protein n=1 Tax=Paraburkholderia phenoliruptrix TaxID=252970 RepID=A0A6J5K605_9BURK|nr:hypothetical protein LMG9964_02383 [Paraburkholderia phenoliruptrix]